MSDLPKIDWRIGDFSIRHSEVNQTIELVKWFKQKGLDKEFCYTICYFWWDEKNLIWELKMAGDRFMDIPDDDIECIFKMLKVAYSMLPERKWTEE